MAHMEGLSEELSALRKKNELLERSLEQARQEIDGLRLRISALLTEPRVDGTNSDSTGVVESNNNTSLSSHREAEEPTKRNRKRKERSSSGEAGQSRYWTSEEHKLFLEALQTYGHKDLRNISLYVGTRNMTQVRTHAQKYFMRLMREAKRLRESVETQPKVEGSDAEVEDKKSNEEVRSVPADCGVSLLSLVAQETCLV